jgi:D-apiose dehydrogenase
MRGALIGCGFFAANHMRAWAGLEGARIVAVCDTDPAKAAAFARAFGAEPFTDAAAMLQAVQPDFADIATTVASHRALVTLAAAHCRAVICQKPFAESIEDGAAMVAACRDRGVALLVHENFRWQAPYRALAAAVASGVIGPPTFLRLSFRHAHDIYANQPYLAVIEDLALTDVGLHLFDMARAVLGEVTLVACQAQRLNPRVAGQDAFLATLRHASGAVSSVECSFFSHYAPDRFVQTLAVVEGPLGSIELLQDYRLRLHKDGRVTETDVEPAVPAWGERPWHLVQESVIAFQRHALAVMRGEEEAQPSGADNLRTLAVTLAAIRSAATGQTIAPENPG